MDMSKGKDNTSIKETGIKTADQIMKLGSWNARSTCAPGALKNLVNIISDYNIGVLAIQETKQKGNETIKVNDYMFFNSGGVTNKYLGVGFLINKKLKQTVIDFEAISDRICKLRMRGKYRKISIINVHAPTEEKEKETKEVFYEEMERVIANIPRYDLKIVVGDFNAKVGNEQRYRKTVGGKSKHEECNDNGRLLVEFALEQNMRIMSTYFDHKNIHKETWIAPNGLVKNQIDHVLVETKHAQAVKDVRSYRGADADTDHILMITTIKQELPTFRTTSQTLKRYDISRLSDPAVAQAFEKEVTEKLEIRNEHNDINNEWERITTSMEETAQHLLCSTNSRRNKDWFDEECREALRRRNAVRRTVMVNTTEESRKQYEMERKIVKKICRKKKREKIDEKLQAIELHYINKEIRNFYQEVKKSKEPYSTTTQYYRNKDGQLIGDVQGKLNRWEEHFRELLNDQEEISQEMESATAEQIGSEQTQIEDTPTVQEIATIIKQLKNNKSAGENGITSEVIKHGGEAVELRIINLIIKVWEQEEMPESWNKAIVCPIHKKGDKKDCVNYRGIALLDVTYKILARILRNRLSKYQSKEVGEYQGGFKQGRSTSDQILTMKLIQHNSYEQNLPLHMLFIDYKQAYDSIRRSKMYSALEKMEIPKKLRKLVEMTLKTTENKVLVQGKLSNTFTVQKGLRQGDPLSTILFNLVLEAIFRESGLSTKGTIFTNRHQFLAYADDIVLMARTRIELEKAFKALEQKSQEYGLVINEQKTKYMAMPSTLTDQTEYISLKIDANKEYKIERVEYFEYLGVTLTNKGEEAAETEKRLAKGSRTIGALQKMFKSKNISKNAKVRLYKTVIRPTVLYGSENWVLNKTEENKVAIWERKVLRKIYGGVKMGETEWRRRTNRELQEAYGQPDIISTIRAQRARWLGHIARMPEGRWVKRILLRGDHGRKRRGRPRKRWLDSVKDDLKKIGITNWQEKSRDREKWRKIVEELEAMGL